MKTVILLVISNYLYDHRLVRPPEVKNKPLIWVILISWLIAVFEYIFQVPANRIGSRVFTVTQLKIMQECITLAGFTVMAYFLFGQTLRWKNIVSYVLLIGAVYFSFGFQS